MLTEINIRNFAIIDQIQVAFGPGLSVLTGETGAGKSIIIDAVGLLLGGRANPELIRTGAEEASVEALFDLTAQPEARDRLAAAGFEAETELLVKRTISRSGRHRVYINGSLAKVAQLEDIVEPLLAIYGQHEHQQLQRRESHVQLLDRFAGLEAEVTAYRASLRELTAVRERLTGLARAERERQQRLDLLRFQQQEIAAAGLYAGEDEELAAERLRLQNAGRLAAIADEGHHDLYGGERAICEKVGALATGLENLAAVEPRFAAMAEALRSCQYTLEDVASQLRAYGDRIAFDPERQTAVEERLAQIAALKRKYAPTLEAILLHRLAVEEELAELGDIESTRDLLQEKIAVLETEFAAAGARLAAGRRHGAERLRQAVEGELRGLLMADARFEIRFFPLPEPTALGPEEGEFYLAANPGEEAKPLAAIASGGELSRIMLAIKRAAPHDAQTPTLIFDEVDAGIGGSAATAVGRKLKAVAASAQVLCITHLPQVAAFADTHFQVEKGEESGRTRTRVVPLDGEARVREMARMLGGALVTEKTLAHAREMIAECGQGRPLPGDGDKKAKRKETAA